MFCYERNGAVNGNSPCPINHMNDNNISAVFVNGTRVTNTMPVDEAKKAAEKMSKVISENVQGKAPVVTVKQSMME